MITPESILQGDRRALSRLLTLVENHTPEGWKLLNELYQHTGQAHYIGVTGAPGTGKSTLVNQLVKNFRHPPAGQEPLTVGVVAVDPTSPFSGGAVLGDRVRMMDLAGDPGVFIRSMASRGTLGGLAGTTSQLVQVLDAAGFQVIVIETVGAGQGEVEIARLAHTILVVEAPGLGDEIQTIKAGILEIADILVVNKADLPGADQARHYLQRMLAGPSVQSTGHHITSRKAGTTNHQPDPEPSWQVPVQMTTATTGSGIDELAAAVHNHRRFLKKTGSWSHREAERLAYELNILIRDRLLHRWQSQSSPERYDSILQLLQRREISPHQAVDQLIKGDSDDSR